MDEKNPAAEARINSAYPNCHKLNDTLFFVASDFIADKVAHQVGIKGDENSRIQSGAVFRLNHSYSGYTSRALWDLLEHAESRE